MDETQEQRSAKQEKIARAVLPRLNIVADHLATLEDEITRQRVSYIADNGSDVMVLSTVTKQSEHLRSVRELINIRAHRDALLIARTMLEGLGRLRWAFNDKPERTELWLWFGAILDWRQIQKNEADGMVIDPQEKAAIKRYVEAHGPNYLRGSVRKSMKQAEQQHTDYQVPNDPWGNAWTETDLRNMFKEVGMDSLYDQTYRSASEWIHWGPRAILRAMEPVEWGTAGFTQVDWPTASLAMYIACLSLHQSLVVLNDHFSLKHADRLAVVADLMNREVQEAVEKLGAGR